MDFKYTQWQVIDTPGILDHPLEERNTIEMQSITALAHLRAAILYVIDISEQCGYSVKAQVALFSSLKPLFTGKPIVIVTNKIDVMPWEDMPTEDRALIESVAKEAGALILQSSTMTEEGVSQVKQAACDKLLQQRLETKMNGPKVNDILHRLHLAVPKPRDDRVRPPFIPQSVLDAKETNNNQMEEEGTNEDGEGTSNVRIFRNPDDMATEESELPQWLRGFNSVVWKKRYILENDDWKFDTIPEIVDGKNIADYVDSDIIEKLEELEKEEEEREQSGAYNLEDDEEDLDEEQKELAAEIQQKKRKIVHAHRYNKPHNKSFVPRKFLTKGETDVDSFGSHLEEMGLDPTRATEKARSRSQSRVGRKRTRSQSAPGDEEGTEKTRKTSSKSRSRSRSVTPGQGLKDVKQKIQAEKLEKNSFKKRNKQAKKGEGDRVILNLKPKHLFSGKRGGGKTDRR